MNTRFLFFLFLPLLVACSTPISKNSYYPIETVTDLNGVYVSNDSRLEDFLNPKWKEPEWEADSIDVFKFSFSSDGKYLELYGQTSEGFQLLSKFKGKYDKKKYAMQFTLYKIVHPFILYDQILNEKAKIGKDSIGNLIVDYGKVSFGNVGPIMGGDSHKQRLLLRPYDDSLLLYPFKVDNKWGMRNKQNETIIPPIYDFINVQNFKTGLIKYKQNKKWGIINDQNEVILPPLYDNITFGSDSLIFLDNKNKKGIANLEGLVLVQPLYDWIDYYKKDLKKDFIVVTLNNKVGLSKNGKEFIKPVFSEIWAKRETLINNNNVEEIFPAMIDGVEVFPMVFWDKERNYVLDKDLNFRERLEFDDKHILSPFKNRSSSIILSDPIPKDRLIMEVTENQKNQNFLR